MADHETVVSADGTRIAVFRSGEGPPLVLVHGAAANHDRWAPVLPALEERFTGSASREYAFHPDRFLELRVPTLLLQGGDSPGPFMQADEALAATLPDCRIAVMPGQRHAAMDTGTELFTGEVLRFLDPTGGR